MKALRSVDTSQSTPPQTIASLLRRLSYSDKPRPVMSVFGSTEFVFVQVGTAFIHKNLTPNDHYSVRTAPLTSKRCILYIYSTNIAIEYFKHSIYSSFFSLQNALCFVIIAYLVPVLFTFYIQGVLKLKNDNSGAKRLISFRPYRLASRPTSLKA